MGELHDFWFDLGGMSDAKEDIVMSVINGMEHNCPHPLTAHTGTAGTYPWKICAHPGCGCQILSD